MELNKTYGEDISLIRSNVFQNEILLIDGQARSGKNLIAVLLSTMSRVEKMRLDSQVDYIARYYFLGKLSLDAATTALRTVFDEGYYNNLISRDVNFRLDDYSGVMKQGKRLKYFLRLFYQAEDKAVLSAMKSRPIFQEMTHDGLHVAKLYFHALGSRLKIIHIFRDPVGNIFEQNKRGFGTRIGTDPREFQLTHLYQGLPVPIMVIGREEEYINANALERLVLIVDVMFRLNLEGFYDLAPCERARILFIEFEDFVVSPEKYIKRFEEFVGDTFGPQRRRILKRENCPRIINHAERERRINEINSNLSPHFREIFEELIRDFDLKPWLKLQ